MDLDNPRSIRDIGATLDSLTERLGGPRVALNTHWVRLVGPVLAQHSLATSLHEGILRVACDAGVWASEIQGHAPDILRRWNSTVPTQMHATTLKTRVDPGRLRDVQTKVGGIQAAMAGTPQPPNTPKPMTALSRATIDRIQALTAQLDDPELRAAVTRAIVLTEARRQAP